MARPERRKSARGPVHSDVTGGVVLIEHLQILDLSQCGVRFLSTRRLSPGQSVNLELRKEQVRVNLRGKVVRSAFVGAVPLHGREHISYEVAVAFEIHPDSESRLAEFVVLTQHAGKEQRPEPERG